MATNEIKNADAAPGGFVSLLLSDRLFHIFSASFFFLFLVFFIPLGYVAISTAKEMVLAAWAILSSVWLALRYLTSKDLRVGFGATAMFSVAIAAYISGWFTDAWRVSLFGVGFNNELLSAAGISLMLMPAIAIASIPAGVRSARGYLYALIAASSLAAIFHLARLVFPSLLGLGAFRELVAGPLMNWESAGLLAGLSAVVLAWWRSVANKRGFDSALVVTAVLALAALASRNILVLVLIPVLSFSLATLSFFGPSSEGDKRKRPVSLIILGAIFVAAALASGYLPSFGAPAVHKVSMTWGDTWSVIKSVSKKDLLLGVGPNRLNIEWALSRTDSFNLSPFYSTDFSFLKGLLSSFVASVGLAGLAALLWVSYVAVKAARALISSSGEIRKVGMAVAGSALLLAVYSAIEVPSASVLVSLFVMTGALVSISSFRELLSQREEIGRGPSLAKRIAIPALVVLMLAVSVMSAYGRSAGLYAETAIRKGYKLNSPQSVKEYAIKAAFRTNGDIYWRILGGIETEEISRLSEMKPSKENSEAIQAAMSRAEAAFKDSITADPENYINWYALGQFYEFATAAFNAKNAAEGALLAYTEALRRSPDNPALKLSSGRVRLLTGENKEAKEDLRFALALKPNYSEAGILLSSVQLERDRDPKTAIATAESLAASARDGESSFWLGYLLYRFGDFSNAANALEIASVLSEGDIRPVMLLGLSYGMSGEAEKATKAFELAGAIDPARTDTKEFLSNIKNGNEPFYGFRSGYERSLLQAIRPPVAALADL